MFITRLFNHLSLVLTVLLVAVLSFVAGSIHAPQRVIAQLPSAQLTPAESQLTDVYTRLSPSIVSISIAERFAGDFTEVSGGSGFVLDGDGHIVTNYHVVNDVSNTGRIEVNFIDGTIVRGEVVGKDADSDIAVIQVEVPQERLFPITFADSDLLLIGQSTVAMGSPFGQKWTMTSGIISALDRTITGLGEGQYQIGAVIQTDAAINPGNSGGPLLNLDGEVLGVNSQIISEERVNSGIGFAIPSNLVQRVARDLIADGAVAYAYLGVAGDEISLDLIEDLELPNNVRGVSVNSFGNRGGISPARDGGVLEDDIITAIDGRPVTSFGTLIAYLSTWTRPGQTVRLTVLRAGDTLDFEVTLAAR
ncbi:MAG: trypsin-like peptidase domain-containing protein [Armatimonadetes bacterium]|nr:trypsin-like peptidase domain-containing protein [Anaerolineae bacterium]